MSEKTERSTVVMTPEQKEFAKEHGINVSKLVQDEIESLRQNSKSEVQRLEEKKSEIEETKKELEEKLEIVNNKHEEVTNQLEELVGDRDAKVNAMMEAMAKYVRGEDGALRQTNDELEDMIINRNEYESCKKSCVYDRDVLRVPEINDTDHIPQHILESDDDKTLYASEREEIEEWVNENM